MRLLACALAFALPQTALAADLSGHWEVQSMGSDREIVIQQRGKKLVAHRVMWPDFEGERYKLEHLYRGTLAGERLTGELLVREEGQRQYEVLRAFVGEVSARGVKLDGMGLRRIEGGAAPEVPSPAATESSRGSAVTAGAEAPPVPAPPPAVVPSAVPATPPPAPADSAAGASASDAGTTLFTNIMGAPGGENLFQVSMAVTMSSDAADLIAAADTLARQKKHAAALAKYEEAARLGESAGLLHRMGRCQLALRRNGEARQLLGRALRLDPQNAELRREYARAKKRT